MFEQLKHTLAQELNRLKTEAQSVEHAIESAYEHSTIHFVVSGIWNTGATLAERLETIYKAGYAQAQMDAAHFDRLSTLSTVVEVPPSSPISQTDATVVEATTEPLVSVVK
jgi:hypothetical protein